MNCATQLDLEQFQIQQQLFFKAIELNDLNWIKSFINETLSPSYQQFRSYMDQNNIPNHILHHVAQSTYDSIAMFEYLLSLDDMKDVLESQDDNDYTPLLRLASQNKSISFQYLIDVHNANIECTNGDGVTVAHLFAQHGNIEMIDYIYNKSSQLITQRDEHHLSPFSSAIFSGQLPIVKHFIQQYNITAQLPLPSCETILHLAVQKGSIEFVEYILQLNPSFLEKICASGMTPLFHACKHANIDVFHHLINHHSANPFILTLEKYNLMHYAVLSNNTNMIKAVATLFENETNIHEIENSHYMINRSSPVYSIPNGYPRIVGEWIDTIESPLHIALQYNQLDVVKQLIQLKANITKTNIISSYYSTFKTILAYTCDLGMASNDYTIMEYILSEECVQDWNSEELKFNDETTITVYGQNDPIAPQLEIRSEFLLGNSSLLLLLASKHQFTPMKLLIEKKANVDAIDYKDNDHNILHYIFFRSPYNDEQEQQIGDFLHYLFSVESCTPTMISAKTTYDMTPLLSVAEKYSFPIVQQLINAKANLNDIDDDQDRTILHLAVCNPDPTLTRKLLQHYPDELNNQLVAYDIDGYTPFLLSILYIQDEDEEETDDDITNTITFNNIEPIDDIINNTNFHIHSPDVFAFIQHDPQLLYQIHRDTDETILHTVVHIDIDYSIRLIGLIEAVIDHLDLFSPY